MLKLAVLATLLVIHDGHEDGDAHPRGCGTEEYNDRLLANDGAWAKSLEDFEVNWRKRQTDIESGTYKSARMQITTFPIIFHVVSPNPNDDVSDSALTYQLKVLHDDFSASNSDYTTGTPQEFRSVRSGDTQIRFEIQSVIRVQSPISTFTLDNAIKFSARGGSDAINPETNLNIWVGPLFGGIMGYAQYPGGTPSTDGVVCDIETLSPEVGPPPFNLGRTATHEVGHYFNLKHIWSDSKACTDNDKTSDYVLDTPPSNSANSGCPTGIKHCKKTSYSQDMYMNYMDYSDDGCAVMFTQLQNARIQASIEQYRGGFISSFGTAEADQAYINWLYFTRFEQEQDDNNKCIGDIDHILFYDNNIHQDSVSDVYIYGCFTKTKVMSVSHMTDIKLIGANEECGDGYFKASQDLNEGNDGAIYMCYNKVDSTADNGNSAILDITFIKSDDIATEDLSVWQTVNANPNGIKLNFALKKGEYYEGMKMVLNGSSNDDDDNSVNYNIITINNLAVYIAVIIGVCIFVSILVCVFVCIWKYVCTKPQIKKNINLNESLAKQYGTTTELTTIQI